MARKTQLEIVVRIRCETIMDGRGEWTVTEERVVAGNELYGAVVDGRLELMAAMPLDDARVVADRVMRNKTFIDASNTVMGAVGTRR